MHSSQLRWFYNLPITASQINLCCGLSCQDHKIPFWTSRAVTGNHTIHEILVNYESYDQPWTIYITSCSEHKSIILRDLQGSFISLFKYAFVVFKEFKSEPKLLKNTLKAKVCVFFSNLSTTQ